VPSADVRAYVSALQQEAALYADRAFLGGRVPSFVYFGGGTPSYLSGSQLRELFGAIRSVHPWADDAEVTFECEPGTLREPKVQALRELGVTRLSLGVENFDNDLLELNGRAHGARHIQPAFEMCRRAGFEQINIDLIAGMLGESDDNWRHNIESTIALAPDSVTIYQMEVPFNTRIHRAIRAGEDLGGDLASFVTRRRWTAEAFEMLESAGYELSSGYTAVRKGSGQRFVYRDSLWHGADLLGLGVSAFGHIGGAHFQNDKHMPHYVERVSRGELPLQRGMSLSSEHRLIRELVLQLKLGRVEVSYFREKFGTDVIERFRHVLEAHHAAGWSDFDEESIHLSRHGLMRVDRLLHDFFLPEHRPPQMESSRAANA
jgi:oxygen-independent coproporphyrinogen-3 oxidase